MFGFLGIMQIKVFLKIKTEEEYFMQFILLISAFMFLLFFLAIIKMIIFLCRSFLHMILTEEGFYGPGNFRRFISWSEVNRVYYGFIELQQDAFFQYPKFLKLEKRKKRIYYNGDTIELSFFEFHVLVQSYHYNYQEREMQQD